MSESELAHLRTLYDSLRASRDRLLEQNNRLRASHNRLLEAAKGLLRFNEELCVDINVSKHYPAEKVRAAIAGAEELAP